MLKGKKNKNTKADVNRALEEIVVYEVEMTPEVQAKIRKIEQEYGKELEKRFAKRDKQTAEAMRKFPHWMRIKAA